MNTPNGIPKVTIRNSKTNLIANIADPDQTA